VIALSSAVEAEIVEVFIPGIRMIDSPAMPPPPAGECRHPRLLIVAATKAVDTGVRRHDDVCSSGGSILRIPGISRPKFAGAMTSRRRDHMLGLVRDAAVRFEPTVRVRDCRGVKDNKYLELALAASATVIIASDQDLLVLDPWRGVRIIRPAAYLAV
jgi:hypothetical protein